MSWLAIYISIGWLLRAAMTPVILRRHFAPGAAVAWLGIIFLHPYIGALLYAMFGETRLGPHRVERHRALVDHFRSALRKAVALRPHHAAPQLVAAIEPMVRQAEKISGMPVLGGNGVDFFTESAAMVDRLVADLDAATSSAHLLYYILAPDATGNRVVEALERASRRGVMCRVLLDAVASRAFHPRRAMARRLKAAGVELAAALPVAPISRRLPRMDLRNHRKLSVIDNRVAYAGSHNLVNPDYGGRHGGPWVDATGRFTGPVVSELGVVFAEDWAFETGKMLDVSLAGDGAPLDEGAPMQAAPTGPTSPGESFRRVFLAAVQSAQKRVMMTTPYFVPDETTLVALMMAADRGAQVSLLLPRVPDHQFTAAAGRASFTRLMRAGVRIYLYRPGLLHTKSTTVDDDLAVFGSANLDVRSFNLNFELTMLIYGPAATGAVRQIQERYLADCDLLDPKSWEARPTLRRYYESAVSMLSPLL